MLLNCHIGRFFLGSLCVGDLVRFSNLTAPNLQHTAKQEQNDQCGNQQHSRKLLMMDILMYETC